jgi:hypothetical protein
MSELKKKQYESLKNLLITLLSSFQLKCARHFYFDDFNNTNDDDDDDEMNVE